MKNTDLLLSLMQAIFPNKTCTHENLDEFLQQLAIVDAQQSKAHSKSTCPSLTKKSRAYSSEKIMSNTFSEDLQSEPYLTFEKMRQLSRNHEDLRDFINYYGTDANTFCKQAHFMEDFTDNYGSVIPFDEPYATYNRMTNSQLRTYFTWRTKVRQGIIENVPASYIFCYVYELLNDVGGKNAAECIEKLITLWIDFRQYTDLLDYPMATWIRDYYVEHNSQLPNDFSQYSSRFPIQYYYVDVELIKQIKACTWDNLHVIEESSSFKISNGQFFKSSNQDIIEKCVCFTIWELAKVFKSGGVNLRNLFFENRKHKIFSLYPNAVHPEVIAFPITVELNAFVTIQGTSHGWYRTYSDHEKYRPIIGYILKLIEIKMRQYFGYKKNLQPPRISIVENCFLHSEPAKYCPTKQTMSKLKAWKGKAFDIINSPRFEEAITCAISDCCKTEHIVAQNGIISVLKPIEIDMSKIKDIERDHMETAKKLIVTESLPARNDLANVHANTVPNAVPIPVPDSVSVPISASASDSISAPASDSISAPISDSISAPASDSISAPISALASDSISASNSVPSMSRTEMMGTEVLVASLSAESKALLRVILSGQAPPNSELLIDAINEKALEAISDNLIDYAEGVPYVYDDYIDELKLSLGGN